ncbi:MAG: homoserine kinase [Bacillota bacterium]
MLARSGQALRRPLRVSVIVPATTANLGAGCDCFGLALSLYNTISVEITGAGLEVSVSGEGADSLPHDDGNMVLQAARKLWDEVSFPVPAGLKITLKNEIPVSAGMGSSAAAIVGGMTAANALAGNTLAADDILNLSARFEGHPDNVAAAVHGGSVVAVADGSGVVTLKLPVPGVIKAVVAAPDFALATIQARMALPDVYPREDALFNLGRAALLAGAFASGRYELLRYGMQDRLHQPYRAPLVNGLGEVLAAAVDAGALGAALSGAGPAVVALTDGATGDIAKAMVNAFETAGVGARIFELVADNEGARVSVTY